MDRQHEHADQIRLRGSVGLATDASGTKITDSDTRYSPYGVTRPGLAGTGLPTDRRFTGQREETSLGFYDYGARPYDPALGRFLQADTLVPEPANPQSLNRYSYVLGNPLRYTDPSGHFAWIPFLAVGGAIFTGITYCVTSDTFNGTEFALAIGTGLVGGALIGTGVGVIAAASVAVIPAVTTMQMATIAIGAGTGGLVSAESYMFTTDDFDNTDFAIRTTLGGVEGGLTSAMKIRSLIHLYRQDSLRANL